MAAATLEELIQYLATKPSPFDMVRRMPFIIEGLTNMAERLQAVEHDRLQDLHRVETLESLTKEERAVLASVETDRTALQKEVAALGARIDALEKAKVAAEKPPVVEAPKPSLAQTLGMPEPAPAPSA